MSANKPREEISTTSGPNWKAREAEADQLLKELNSETSGSSAEEVQHLKGLLRDRIAAKEDPRNPFKLESVSVKRAPASRNKVVDRRLELVFFGLNDRFLDASGYEMTICLDYELARESPEVVQIVQNWAEPEQRVQQRLSVPQYGRWAGGPAATSPTSEGQQDSGAPDLLSAPLIPTVCLATRKWFPKPWLSIPTADRKKLVKRFSPAYDHFRPLIISEGCESAEQRYMRDKAMNADNQDRGHCFKRYTILLDWSEPPTRLRKRFESWLDANRPADVKTRSQRGRHGRDNPAELLRALTSYRLQKLPLPLAKRQILEGKLGIDVNRYKISRGKKTIEKELRRRKYLP